MQPYYRVNPFKDEDAKYIKWLGGENEQSEKLKAERKAINFTQEEVAEKIGITPAYIGHIERGDRTMSLDTLIRLCMFYRVTIDYLLSDLLPIETDNITAQIKAMLYSKSPEQQTAILDIMKAVIRNV